MDLGELGLLGEGFELFHGLRPLAEVLKARLHDDHPHPVEVAEHGILIVSAQSIEHQLGVVLGVDPVAGVGSVLQVDDHQFAVAPENDAVAGAEGQVLDADLPRFHDAFAVHEPVGDVRGVLPKQVARIVDPLLDQELVALGDGQDVLHVGVDVLDHLGVDLEGPFADVDPPASERFGVGRAVALQAPGGQGVRRSALVRRLRRGVRPALLQGERPVAVKPLRSTRRGEQRVFGIISHGYTSLGTGRRGRGRTRRPS